MVQFAEIKFCSASAQAMLEGEYWGMLVWPLKTGCYRVPCRVSGKMDELQLQSTFLQGRVF